MPLDVLRRLTLLHGIVAWLDTLLLVVLSVLLLRKEWRDKPKSWILPIVASLGAIATFASGMALEMHYRVHLRQRLFITSKNLGWLFERKMHLSFGVFFFATIGLLTLFLTRKDTRFFNALRSAYLLAAMCGLTSSVISTVVRMAGAFGK